MYKLVIQDDEGKTTVVPLIRDEITIGRKEGNTIRLTERNVSRKHARIMRSNGTVAIEDLGSYNGVRVNGTRISQRTPLTVSDRVQIGDYLIELKAEGAEQAIPASQSYEDAKTQPVERFDPGYAARMAAVAAQMPPPGSPAAQVPSMPPMHPGQATAQGAGHVGTMVTPPAGVIPTVPPMAPGMGVPGMADVDPRMPRAAVVAPLGAATSGNARLVVLSSNFAGREFDLTKPQMVIGRTDDNDVVINHRSISRNHAKVVREPETGRYTISDLQSSNGVRVNGEEYGKVELRRGDIVDLGHVRLRFVDIGEDFVFGRDAQAVDVPTGGSKGLWIALAGLIVVGGIVGVVLATRGEGKSEGASALARDGSGADPTGGGLDGAAAVPAVAVSDATGAPTAPPTPPTPPTPGDGKKLNELKTTMNDAVTAEKWPEVLSACNAVLQMAPDDAECLQKKEQAKREQAAQLKFDDFNTGVQRKDYLRVARSFDDIDDQSMYKERARAAHDRLRDEFVGQTRVKAQALIRQGKCRDVEKLAETAGKIWREASVAARAEASKCGTVATEDRNGGGVAGGGATTVKKEEKKEEKKHPDETSGGGSTTATGGGTAAPSKDPAQLVSDANAAARAGQYGKALRSAEEALRVVPNDSGALTAAAIAACNLKQADKAKKYIGKLTGQRQGMVRQVCLRNNVTID